MHAMHQYFFNEIMLKWYLCIRVVAVDYPFALFGLVISAVAVVDADVAAAANDY